MQHPLLGSMDTVPHTQVHILTSKQNTHTQKIKFKNLNLKSLSLLWDKSKGFLRPRPMVSPSSEKTNSTKRREPKLEMLLNRFPHQK